MKNLFITFILFIVTCFSGFAQGVKSSPWTTTTDPRVASASVGVLPASPLGGNSAYADLAAATPAYQGQLAVGYYGDKRPVLGFAGSTTVGDWVHSFNFSYGIAGIGLSGVNSSTHAANGIYPDPITYGNVFWTLNGGPVGWAATGDALVIVENFSTNSSQSGGGVSAAIMAQDPTTHLMFDLDSVGGPSLMYVATNKLAALDPGYSILVWNGHASGSDSNNLGMVFSTPGSQSGGGNTPYLVLDSQAGLFRVPYWGNGTANYTPLTGAGGRNTQWGDSFLVNPATGNAWVTNNLTVGGTLTAGLFSGSGASLTSLNAANLSTGTVPTAQLPNTVNGHNLGGATLNATNLSGQLPALNGSALTSLTAANLTGALPTISGASLTSLTPVGSPLLQRTLWTDGIVACSGTSETLISSNQIPAGILPVGGQILYTVFGTNNTTASTRTFKIYVGTSSATAATLSTASKAWVVRITISRISTSVVDVDVESTMGSAQQATILAFTDVNNWGTNPELVQATITDSVATGDFNVRCGKAILIP